MSDKKSNRPGRATRSGRRTAGVKTSAASPHLAAAWTFLTNHAHVLLCIAADPEVRLRDVASRVGITERAVQKIVAELEDGGIITRTRDGRRNRYAIDADRPLRHPIESHCTVAVLLDMLKQ